MTNMLRQFLVGAWLVSGCGAGDLEQAVLQRTGATPCAEDAECLISHNTCEPLGACSHEQDIPVTPDVVCDPPRYTTPDASACVCGDASICDVR